VAEPAPPQRGSGWLRLRHHSTGWGGSACATTVRDGVAAPAGEPGGPPARRATAVARRRCATHAVGAGPGWSKAPRSGTALLRLPARATGPSAGSGPVPRGGCPRLRIHARVQRCAAHLDRGRDPDLCCRASARHRPVAARVQGGAAAPGASPARQSPRACGASAGRRACSARPSRSRARPPALHAAGRPRDTLDLNPARRSFPTSTPLLQTHMSAQAPDKASSCAKRTTTSVSTTVKQKRAGAHCSC